MAEMAGSAAGSLIATMQLRLLASQVVSLDSELMAEWASAPPQGPIDQELIKKTLAALSREFSMQTPTGQAYRYAASKKRFARPEAVLRASGHLGALDLALGLWAGPESLTGDEYAKYLFVRLNEPAQVLTEYSAVLMVHPLRSSVRLTKPDGGLGAWAGELREALALPVRVLARCLGVSVIGGQELLELGNGDLATAVASAVAAMRCPGVPAVPRLEEQLWRALHRLASPQVAAELADQVGWDGSTTETIQDLQAEHVAHAHRFAACLVQFDALEAACSGVALTGTSNQRALVLTLCLRAIRAVAASPHFGSAARLVARQLVLLWGRLGCRLLAPHLRRLLSIAGSGGRGAEEAARTLRGDLRTLAWLLRHAPELRPHLRPLCSELASKSVAASNAAETLAVIIGAAANANALVEELGGGPLYALLNTLPTGHKLAIQEAFQRRANNVWILPEAHDLLDSLVLWPASLQLEAAPTLEEAGAAAWEDVGLEDDADGDWAEWDDGLETGTGECVLGPLALPPLEPPPSSGDLTRILCSAPQEIRCAIDGRICVSPVVAGAGAPRFEHSSLLLWASRSLRCPVTGQPLDAAEVFEDTEAAEYAVRYLAGWYGDD